MEPNHQTLVDFGEHVGTCTRCQQGPASLCEEGRAIADRFNASPDDDIPAGVVLSLPDIAFRSGALRALLKS